MSQHLVTGVPAVGGPMPGLANLAGTLIYSDYIRQCWADVRPSPLRCSAPVPSDYDHIGLCPGHLDLFKSWSDG